MAQILETNLTPEQAAAQVIRIILFDNPLSQDHVAFLETFASLGTMLPIHQIDEEQLVWFVGNRLFLDKAAIELSSHGGNVQAGFFPQMLYPVWETIIGSIVLVSDVPSFRWVGAKIQTARAITERESTHNLDDLPYLLVGLKRQGPGLHPLIARALFESLPKPILMGAPTILCDPTDQESVKEVLLTAMEHGLRYLISKSLIKES